MRSKSYSEYRAATVCTGCGEAKKIGAAFCTGCKRKLSLWQRISLACDASETNFLEKRKAVVDA